jgi:hypothetical protein
MRVAICTLTGRATYRELLELRATGANDVRDFSSYGFSSTDRATNQELVGLFHAMLSDAYRSSPALVIMELAGGFLQRETKMLLEEADIRRRIMGILVAATCAPSALYTVTHLARLGHNVMGVTGVITSSPSCTEQFACRSNVPLVSSADSGEELARLVMRHLALARFNESRRANLSVVTTLLAKRVADPLEHAAVPHAELVCSEAA